MSEIESTPGLLTFSLREEINPEEHEKLINILRTQGIAGTITVEEKKLSITPPHYADPQGFAGCRVVVENVLREFWKIEKGFNNEYK